MKKPNLIFLMFFIMFLSFSPASKAQPGESLSTDTITMRLFGTPINLTPALNIKVSFTSPDVVNLSNEPPSFQALGASELLTSSDPDSQTISVIWDGTITNNEAKITFMLEPGRVKGLTAIMIDSVETAGGRDITGSIVVLLDKQNIVNSIGTVATSFGDFTLVKPEKLIAPGRAAVIFRAENIKDGLSALLNGSSVEFTEDGFGVGIVDLPESGGKLNLTLGLLLAGRSEKINLGTVNIERPGGIGLPPRIDKVLGFNTLGGPKLQIKGRQFGVKRFGRDGVTVEILPSEQVLKNRYLESRSTKGTLRQTRCIKEGAYVNISHEAGTDAKKVTVLGECN